MKVVVNCSELIEQVKSDIRVRIESLVAQLQSLSNLALDTLDEIIIPDDFDTELVNFQKANGVPSIGRTNSDAGLAIAKAVPYWKEGELHQSIFLDKEQWLCRLCLLEPEDDNEYNPEDEYNLVVHVLHHELAHVQNNLNQCRIWGDTFPEPRYNNLKSLQQNLAKGMWEEYYAERTAGKTAHPYAVAQTINRLCDVLDYVQLGKTNLATCTSPAMLFEEVYKLSWRLLSSMGVVLGCWHHWVSVCGEDQLQEMQEEIENQFDDINDLSTKCDSMLSSLFVSYPKWEGISVLDELSGVVLDTFNKLGIAPRQTPNGVWIDIVPAW
jgi:hypothetical protein